jgi:helicase MOV-10
VCALDFISRQEYDRHQRTAEHRTAVESAAHQPSIQLAPPTTRVTGTPAGPGYIQCDICHKDIHVDVWIAHTTRHTSHQQRAALGAALEEAEKDKNGITVSYKRGINFGIIDPAEALLPDLRRTADVKVGNSSDAGRVILHAICLASSTRGDNYGTKCVTFKFVLQTDGDNIHAGFLLHCWETRRPSSKERRERSQ